MIQLLQGSCVLLFALAWIHVSNGFLVRKLLGVHSSRSKTIVQGCCWVDGMECTRMDIPLPEIGTVSILEATATTQNELVNLALDEESTLSDNNLSLTSGDPYGAVLWPASTTISRYIIEQEIVKGKTVVELGCGTGLVSLACSLAGAKSVLATDYENIPLSLLRHAAEHWHSLTLPILQYAIFDICDTSSPLPSCDVLVAADIMYEPSTGRCMARRVHEALEQGSRVIVGDSPGRAGRPAFLEELERLGISGDFVSIKGSTVQGPRHDLICGKTSSTVSESPQELIVAVLDLDPTMLRTPPPTIDLT